MKGATLYVSTSHESPAPRYWGLKPDVAWRIELGLAFVDDGERVFRIDAELWRGVLATGDTPASPAVEAVLEAHSSLFTRHPTRGAAFASLVEET